MGKWDLFKKKEEAEKKESKPENGTLHTNSNGVQLIPEEILEKPDYSKLERKVRIGAIGVGDRLQSLLRIMQVDHKDLFEIVGISDEAPPAIKEAQEFLRYTGPTFSDHKEMLKAIPDIDWVMIGSKNFQHRQHCLDAFAAGKHVFCEKPLATSIEECQEILHAQKKSGKLFATGFVLRHAPLYVKINEILKSGEIGKLVSVNADELLHPGHGGYIMRNWRRFKDQAGPHLLEKCCHDIDVLNWLIGSVPKRVASFGGTDVYIPENKPKIEEDLDLYYEWDTQTYEKVDPFDSQKDIVDNQVCIMEYYNNVRATFHTNSNSAWKQRRLTLCCTKGTIEGDLIDGSLRVKYISNRWRDERVQLAAKGCHGGADVIIVNDLAKSMLNSTAPKASGEEGLLSAVVCLAVEEARLNGNVVQMDQYWKMVDRDFSSN